MGCGNGDDERLAVEPHRSADTRQELLPGPHRSDGRDVQVDEHPGVASVVHRVVDELGVPLRGDALARRVEIRLVGHGVLEVAEVVPLVREQLQKGDAEVRGAALREGGVPLRDEVDQHLPEARVVLREVVERGLGQDVGRAEGDRRAVEVDRATRAEVDPGDREEPVDVGEVVAPDPVRVARPADRQEVRREVALLVHVDVEDVRIGPAHRRSLDGDPHDARSAVDVEPATRLAGRP